MTALTTVGQVKSFLGKDNASHDGLLGLLIDGISARMETHVGRVFSLEEYTSELVETPGFAGIVLDHGPVENVITVVEGASTLTSADYLLELPQTLLRLTSGVISTWARGEVYVTYEAGYEDVPADLELACVEQVAREYGMTTAGGANVGIVRNSPTQGSGESVQYEMKSWLPQVLEAMKPYRRLI